MTTSGPTHSYDARLRAEYRRRLSAEQARRAAATDPVAFAPLVGLTPDPWQLECLRSGSERVALNCCRQSGKSTTAALLALWNAVYRPGALVLLISPSDRQSRELLRKVIDHLRKLDAPPKLRNESKHELEFGNGSRIVSLPASEGTIRGYSAAALIIEDEAGDVPDELHDAVRPMLAVSRGRHLVMGTPKGRQGHFYELWEGGKDWQHIQLRANQCPRYSAEWLEAERDSLSRRGLLDLYRQEYEGAFVDAAAGRVYRAFDPDRNVTSALPDGGEWTYILGLDFGIVDPNAFSVVGWRAHDPTVYVLEAYTKQGDALVVADEVDALSKRYQFSRIVGDEGGMGKGFAELMRQRRSIPVTPAEKHNKNGFISLFNGELAAGRVQLVEAGTAELRDEWARLSWAEGGRKEAEGQANHASDATLYAWRATTAYAERTATKVDTRTQAERIHEETQRHWEVTEQDIAREKQAQREEYAETYGNPFGDW